MKEFSMKHKRNQRSRAEAPGVVIPPDLTDTFRKMISQLVPSVKTDHLKREAFSKYVSDDTLPASDRRNAAILKWMVVERDNEATNHRLLITPESYHIMPRVTYGRFVDHCRKVIVAIIGETVPEEVLLGAFSGGASTSRNRACSFPASKFLGQADVTPRASELFAVIREDAPGWLGAGRPEYREVLRDGNELFTVPKKTDIDRCACKEPDINMYMQKGAGSFFRRKLRAIGINLNDQARNRSLAREGSLTGRLATLDLSSASDCVTTGLVAEMLPVCWYTLLDSLRSPVTVIDGCTHRNEMFSSMGNGFTFELESLLFYSIAKTVQYFEGVRGIVSVYGDDIICPSEIFESLCWVLGWFGFTVNTEKSFASGPFRESCGGHYYNGIDITPFYVKGPLKTVVDVIHAANQLRKWAKMEGFGVLNCEVEDFWLYLKSLVPERLWGGEDLSFKYQLVSHDRAHSRAVAEVDKKPTGLGGYLHWLNTTWDRSRDEYYLDNTYGPVSGSRLVYSPIMRYPTWETHGRDGVSTSERTIELPDRKVPRLERVRSTVPRLEAYFLSELREEVGSDGAIKSTVGFHAESR